METLINIDRAVFYFLNSSIANPLFDAFFPFITELKNWMLVYIIAILLLLWKGGKTGRYCVLCLAVVIFIADQTSSTFIKELVSRIRPCRELDDVRLLVACGAGKSFPSSHATNNFAAAFVFSYFFKQYKWLFFGIAIAMAFSRVYVGVHYPIDIISGSILGSVIAIGILEIFKNFDKKYQLTKRFTIITTEDSK